MKKTIKNAKVEQLTKMILSCEEEKGLIVKAPFAVYFWEHHYSPFSQPIKLKFYVLMTPSRSDITLFGII